ncbi:MAG: hypothetical protein IPH88_14080 [Bacteroidales bacterium]|nr:hypothetical protein [Bacteroidales bacterium]
MISITDFGQITKPEVLSALLIFSTCNHSDFLLFETGSESEDEYSTGSNKMNNCPEKDYGLNYAFPLPDFEEVERIAEEVQPKDEEILVC